MQAALVGDRTGSVGCVSGTIGLPVMGSDGSVVEFGSVGFPGGSGVSVVSVVSGGGSCGCGFLAGGGSVEGVCGFGIFVFSLGSVGLGSVGCGGLLSVVCWGRVSGAGLCGCGVFEFSLGSGGFDCWL